MRARSARVSRGAHVGRSAGRRTLVRSAADSGELVWQKESLNSKKRTDLKSIMIIGAGPIVIGQACEFDYSGTQACRALKAEGYKVILINSNPATIMTDPDTADRTYIGPMTPEQVEKVIAQERPDAILPTMGGQTALNLAKNLAENGILEKYNVELIGAKLDAINKAEDRLLFKDAMARIGVPVCPSGIANTFEEAQAVAKEIGSFPLIIRPAFTLGGTGGGVAYNAEEYEAIVRSGLSASVTSQILVEKSLLGWKEYELEVMRDLADNVMIVCTIENFDPMGVHTGDSITVAPAQTLTDKEYQRLRDYSLKIIREIGVECGGSNIQFSTNPENGDVIVIEMNPRVSRSSALASKATGFPIAKIAAKLAVGLTLDGIANDITMKTPASFEPSIDYVVTKIPRFAFEKFAGSSTTLTTQMRSVGESMAIGRTFQESFQKALRSLEIGRSGWGCDVVDEDIKELEDVKYSLRTPNPDRVFDLRLAFLHGLSKEDVHNLTNIDPWFLEQLWNLFQTEQWMKSLNTLDAITDADMWQIKRRGFSDKQIAVAMKCSEADVRQRRKALGVAPAYKLVDTCAAEFEAFTPYMYSTYERECEAAPTKNRKVLILGGGPNRIGQGIEFDYCCCHAAFSLSKAGFETIMVNSNPETVSTDYDTSDRLFFEPLTTEDVIAIIEKENPEGVIVQFGGQTPLKLAGPIEEYLGSPEAKAAGVTTKIWGTSVKSIDIAEDRKEFGKILDELDIACPAHGTATDATGAIEIANRIGYPVVVRPSYVLGGRAMRVVYSDEELNTYMIDAVEASESRPILVDQFLDNASELDIDILADKEGNAVVCGLMEHIELCGIHSGDSACSLPVVNVAEDMCNEVRVKTLQLAKALGVVGLMNSQWAVKDGKAYIIEANPRASRTVPFVAKAVGHPFATYASLLMSGQTLQDIGFLEEPRPKHISVKEVVLPFDKFAGSDTLLGPEMKSTGEVMGIGLSFHDAFAKAQTAANSKLPTSGKAFISVNDSQKLEAVDIAKGLLGLGFKVVATSGTAKALRDAGVEGVEEVLKLHEGRPNISDMMQSDEISLVIIGATTGDRYDMRDGKALRRMAVSRKILLQTTMAGARALVGAIKSVIDNKMDMVALQDYHK